MTKKTNSGVPRIVVRSRIFWQIQVQELAYSHTQSHQVLAKDDLVGNNKESGRNEGACPESLWLFVGSHENPKKTVKRSVLGHGCKNHSHI